MILDTVRQFKKQDFEKLAEFVKKHFHEKYILSDEKFFEWQYLSNPYTNDYAFFLLEKDENIYGYIGMVPLDCKIGDSTVQLNTFVNLFVDERVRSLGFGTLLIKRAMEEKSPAMVIGYNPDSFSIYQKLGDWRGLGKFYRYAYIFNQDSVKKLLPADVTKHHIILNKGAKHDGSEESHGLIFEQIKTFDKSFDDFWKSVRSRYVITTERTSIYMNWRYANHPHFKYNIQIAKKDNQIMGYIIYRIETVDNFSIVRIVDFVSQEQVQTVILQNFLSEVRTQADMADFMFSGQQYHETLKKLGFFDVCGTSFEKFPIYFNPIDYSKNYINFCAWKKQESIDKNVFYNRNNWYLTKGDSDQDRPNPH
tara:strand:- start:4507 stop:5601 length:1095 start_codon:yes stop_codon:yes gene_type:complete